MRDPPTTDPMRRTVAGAPYAERRDNPSILPGDRIATGRAAGDAGAGPYAGEPVPTERAETRRGTTYVPPPSRAATEPYDHRDVVMDDPNAPVAERIAAPAAEPPVADRRFSIGATILGWAVASFFTFVFFALAAALLGGAAGVGDRVVPRNASGLLNWTAASFFVTMFLGYLIGGYAAGRIALWDGAKHGALIVVWPILLGILGAVAGFLMADQIRAFLPAGLSAGELTAGALLTGLFSLAAMLLGGALGGRMGERYHRAETRAYRRRTTSRGRPL